MKPERAAEIVAGWARLYTRGLPDELARRRIEEIEADLGDQIGLQRGQGLGDRRIALSILSRMLRGLAADAAWRGRHAPASGAFRSVAGVAIATASILLVPALAMQFTEEVAWGPADFIFAGVLIFGVGLALRLVARWASGFAYRAAAVVGLGAALLLVWVIGAVGLIGPDGDRADLMYGGVLAVGILGAALARFRPLGMARALLAMALAQGAVTAIALIAGKHEAPVTSVPELLGLNAIFVVLFAGSALLFRRAARGATPPGLPPGTPGSRSAASRR